jgi:hypothetical protein
MRIRLIRQPGQPGTKRLLDEYGAKLVCVRYRYDEALQRRLKTVELIVAETPYTPPAARLKPETQVGVQVGLKEYDVQRLVKAAGGKWNPTRRVWELRYDKAVALELQARIVAEERSISRAKKVSTNRSK